MLMLLVWGPHFESHLDETVPVTKSECCFLCLITSKRKTERFATNMYKPDAGGVPGNDHESPWITL